MRLWALQITQGVDHRPSRFRFARENRSNDHFDLIQKEVVMTKVKFSRGLMVAVILGVFGLGYVCGSMTQRQAEAQMGGLLEKAGKMGGPVGSVAEFGSSIVEMQDHITGLQKNLDTFKKVQSSLTGK
jgi:hypothetical protein